MPYKFNESRRHKIPRVKYRITNWPQYDAALVRRGSLTMWLTDDAIAAWQAPATGKRGGQPIYSSIAIETSLALRLVFHQPLRQTEGLLRSIAGVLKIDIPIPDHTTLSRRGGGLTILPKRIDRNEPLHLLVDSTGLKIYGEGEWLDQKHGIRSRRRWRKLHLGVDADTHEIVAVELTPDDVGDIAELPDLLDQIDADVASLTADGAYDGQSVYDAVAERHPMASVVSHHESRPTQMERWLRSATTILRSLQSGATWVGCEVQAIIAGVWFKPRCFATKPSSVDDFAHGFYPINAPRPNSGATCSTG